MDAIKIFRMGKKHKELQGLGIKVRYTPLLPNESGESSKRVGAEYSSGDRGVIRYEKVLQTLVEKEGGHVADVYSELCSAI